MIIKLLIVLLLLFILFNLFRALLIMVSGKAQQRPMSHYLGRRVLFSVIALLVIIAALKIGLLHSNPSPIYQATTHTQIQIDTARPHQQNANTKPPLEKQNAYHH
ncbi:DUF2909 domain-containing protein [Pseudoalteromonas mariniglutinosa]|uniref:DUF2909 domain-containing protein n=1 Tax=Pseudoalteromonas mariniglutinosa TaxID=206042 RepID=UPI0038501EDC